MSKLTKKDLLQLDDKMLNDSVKDLSFIVSKFKKGMKEENYLQLKNESLKLLDAIKTRIEKFSKQTSQE